MRRATLGKRTVLYSAIALLALIVVSPSAADSPPPATPAQLQAMTDQIGGLQSQRQAKETELGAANADIAKLQGLLLVAKSPNAVKDPSLRAWLWSQGLDPDLAGLAVGVPIGDIVKKEIQSAEKRRESIENQIAGLDQQIAKLEANRAYWANPKESELKGELEHLRNLMNQKPTPGDEQLKWDIENTLQRIKGIDPNDPRIKQLEQQYQQSGSGGTSGGSTSQSGQSQGAYGATTQTTGPSGPSGPMYGQGPWGSPSGSSVEIDHNQLQQSLGAGDKSKHDHPKGGCPG